MRTFALIIALTFAFGAKAQVDFSAQANGLTVTFSITQASNYYEFIYWSFGDGSTANGGITNNPVVHTYSGPGNYSVCVVGAPMPISPNDTACKMVDLTTAGLHDYSSEGGVVLFPNPVKDQLTIQLPNSNAVFEVSIENVLLERVFEVDKLAGQEAVVDVSFLRTGVYYVRVKKDKGQRVFMVVKE